MDYLVHIKFSQITNKSAIRKAFELEDGTYLMTIKPKKNRSLPQNKYYWSVMVPMVLEGLKDIGYNEIKTIEDAHEVLKGLFNKKQLVNPDGVVLEVASTTTKLTTLEFSLYIADVQRWAAEFLNVIIPDPNQQLDLYGNDTEINS
jgi:hypothetical protein